MTLDADLRAQMRDFLARDLRAKEWVAEPLGESTIVVRHPIEKRAIARVEVFAEGLRVEANLLYREGIRQALVHGIIRAMEIYT